MLWAVGPVLSLPHRIHCPKKEKEESFIPEIFKYGGHAATLLVYFIFWGAWAEDQTRGCLTAARRATCGLRRHPKWATSPPYVGYVATQKELIITLYWKDIIWVLGLFYIQNNLNLCFLYKNGDFGIFYGSLLKISPNAHTLNSEFTSGTHCRCRLIIKKNGSVDSKILENVLHGPEILKIMKSLCVNPCRFGGI